MDRQIERERERSRENGIKNDFHITFKIKNIKREIEIKVHRNRECNRILQRNNV